MPWNTISGYLERFKNINPPEKFMQDTVAEAVQTALGVSISSDNIDVRGGVLYIKTANPALKNEIFMRKEKILEKLAHKLGPRAPKEIRF